MRGILVASIAILFTGAGVPGQSTSKFEIRAPKIVVRVKPVRANRPGGKLAGATSGTKTYGDELFVASFEAALTNGNDALTAGDADDALGYFEQAAAMTTDDPRPLIGIGVALWTKKQYSEAQTKFEGAEKRFQATNNGAGLSAGRVVDVEQIYRGLGYVALMAGHYDDALKAYLNVHDSEDAIRVMVGNNMGVALINTSHFHEAETQFEYALRMDPKAQDVRFNLGMLYVLTRDREKAAAVFKELATADPYHAGLLQRELEYLRPTPEP
jgi:tetratricopeptide (TPR) repeat protein